MMVAQSVDSMDQKMAYQMAALVVKWVDRKVSRRAQKLDGRRDNSKAVRLVAQMAVSKAAQMVGRKAETTAFA